MNVDEENKEAEVILSKEALENQLGRYRNNTALASALTGYKISFMTQQEAEENEVSYVSSEIADEEAKRIKAEREADEYRRKSIEDAKRREEEAVAKKEAEEAARKAAEEAARQAEEEAKKADKLARLEPLPENPIAPKAQVKPEEFPMEANNPAAAALAALKSAQKAAATAPVVEEKTEVVSEENRPLKKFLLLNLKKPRKSRRRPRFRTSKPNSNPPKDVRREQKSTRRPNVRARLATTKSSMKPLRRALWNRVWRFIPKKSSKPSKPRMKPHSFMMTARMMSITTITTNITTTKGNKFPF